MARAVNERPADPSEPRNTTTVSSAYEHMMSDDHARSLQGLHEG